MAKIHRIEQGETAGIWLSGDSGTVAIVVKDGVGAWVQLNRDPAQAVPDLALAVTAEGPVIQFRGPDGTATAVGTVRLLEALEKLA